MKIKLVNLTPHPVSIQLSDPSGENADITLHLLPDGRVARCVVHAERVATLGTTAQPDVFQLMDRDNADGTWVLPVRRSRLGKLVGLPDSEPGVWYIVSRIVAEACPDRSDLVFPDQLLRDTDGRVIACVGLGIGAKAGFEVASGVEKWIKYRRNEARRAGDTIAAEVIDGILDDARDAFVEGYMPWDDYWLNERDYRDE